MSDHTADYLRQDGDPGFSQEDAERYSDVIDLDSRRPKASPVRASTASDDLVITPTPWTWRDEATIPPREFIYAGHYVRSYLSQTVANYGVGKSSLTIAEGMVMASGVPFLGIEPTESCPVWIFNGEDPLVELERKIYAAFKFHGLDPRKLAGRLFFDSGRMLKMKVARRLNGTAVVCQDVVDGIRMAIERNRIGVMIVDPFVTTHGVAENNNDEMEVVASTWADIANDTNCSIEIVHHARKTNGADVTMDDARGASSVAAKARSGRLLNPMKESDGAAAGANPFEFFKASYGKSSLRPRTAGEEWYRFHNVRLANGDDVGAIGPVPKPSALENVAEGDLEKAQAAISEGQWRLDLQSKEWAGLPIIAALGLDPEVKADRDRVKGLLKAWTRLSHFAVVERLDPKTRRCGTSLSRATLRHLPGHLRHPRAWAVRHLCDTPMVLSGIT